MPGAKRKVPVQGEIFSALSVEEIELTRIINRLILDAMNKETEITCEQVLSGVRAISMDTPLLAASTELVREPPWPHLKMKGRTNGFMISSVLIDLLIDYDGLVVDLTYIRSSFVPQTNRTFKIKYIHA